MAFDVVLRRTRALVIVAPVGDLDIASAGELRAALVEAVGDGSDRVVVDLAEVGFLDSTGLGQLAWLAAAQGGGRTDALIANARPIVRNALRLMGFDALMEVHAYGEPPPIPDVADTSRE